MAIEKISSAQNIVKPKTAAGADGNNFKALMDSKRAAMAKPEEAVSSKEPVDFAVKKIINDVIASHEKTTQAIKTFISGAHHSPSEMLKIQFVTGEHYTEVQMVAKVGELTANTIKNVSQTSI